VLSEKYKHDYIVTEKFFGTTVDRPKFSRLLKKLMSGDQLIVREVRRIGRNATEVLTVSEDLKSRGVSLVIDNLGMDVTTPAGSMVRTVSVFFKVVVTVFSYSKLPSLLLAQAYPGSRILL